MAKPNNPILPALAGIALVLASVSTNTAFGLKSDRDQILNIDANHQNTVRSVTGKADDPDVTRLDGNVVMTRGTMHAHADRAVIYSNPSGVADANGNVGGPIRAVLTGKPAHMQQIQDVDCRLVTADADTIDYDNVKGIATLIGHVVVVQQGKGDFHGEHMFYNTNTGEMEGGDESPSSRVHMTIQPKSQTAPTASSSGDCTKAAGAH